MFVVSERITNDNNKQQSNAYFIVIFSKRLLALIRITAALLYVKLTGDRVRCFDISLSFHEMKK
jgi:hypothetical protein